MRPICVGVRVRVVKDRFHQNGLRGRQCAINCCTSVVRVMFQLTIFRAKQQERSVVLGRWQGRIRRPWGRCWSWRAGWPGRWCRCGRRRSSRDCGGSRSCRWLRRWCCGWRGCRCGGRCSGRHGGSCWRGCWRCGGTRCWRGPRCGRWMARRSRHRGRFKNGRGRQLRLHLGRRRGGDVWGLGGLGGGAGSQADED